MKIQVNTDSSVEGDQRLEEIVTGEIEDKLSRFREHVTRIEVHIRDENSSKKGGAIDKRCLIEARLRGKEPTAVDHRAPSVEAALNGATKKLRRALDTIVGKKSKHR